MFEINSVADAEHLVKFFQGLLSAGGPNHVFIFVLFVKINMPGKVVDDHSVGFTLYKLRKALVVQIVEQVTGLELLLLPLDGIFNR